MNEWAEMKPVGDLSLRGALLGMLRAGFQGHGARAVVSEGLGRVLVLGVAMVALVGCGVGGAGSGAGVAYFASKPPGAGGTRLIHYPVARQGDLTAWLTSDHVLQGSKFLYAPGDPTPRYPIVGVVRASAMPEPVKHDAALLVVSGYEGPVFELWEGTEAEGFMCAGHEGRWIRVDLSQDHSVNTWVRLSGLHRVVVQGWSGFPVVIGDPKRPDAIAGAMWYKSTLNPKYGGAASTRMVKEWLGRLRLEDFVGR